MIDLLSTLGSRGSVARSRRFALVPVVLACAALGACGEYAGDPSGAYSPAPEPSETSASNGIAAGTLTAGAWDDNRNFGWFAKYLGDHAALEGRPPFGGDEHDAAHETHAAAPAPRETLDVALVIDTTGSMGDEIRYLQVEVDAIASAIAERYPDAEQRWALVAYRDRGDDFVTRSFDFTGDVAELRGNLDRQSAGGGGDYPEAPDAALEAANRLSWRDGPSVARLAFWVADAPHHPERARALADAVRGAAQRDVHVYPIAASGVDELTELTMRSAAQLTGGRYLFLTDDSGIGNAHKEPSIPCYFVTRLSAAMLRMVDIEMTGAYEEPAAADVLRTGGDPVGGQCTLESGDVVAAF